MKQQPKLHLSREEVNRAWETCGQFQVPIDESPMPYERFFKAVFSSPAFADWLEDQLEERFLDAWTE